MTVIPLVTVSLIAPVKYGCALLIAWCLWIFEFWCMWTAFIVSALVAFFCSSWMPMGCLHVWINIHGLQGGTSRRRVFSRTLWQKQWGALLDDACCGVTQLWSVAELFSLGCAKFQGFGLLWIGAVVELYTKRNHIFSFLFIPSNWRDNQNLPSLSHLVLCSLSACSRVSIISGWCIVPSLSLQGTSYAYKSLLILHFKKENSKQMRSTK